MGAPPSRGMTGRTYGTRGSTYATLSRNASSAACTASGVPTCIQTPSSRRPNSRSCSLARSNILVSENSPVGCVGKQRGRHDRRTRIDERHHLVFTPLAQCAVRQHRVVAAAGIADAARGRRHQQQDVHPVRIEGFGKPRQIGPHAVDPHRVGIEVKERIVAEQGQRLHHGAAGAEHLVAFVGNDDAGPGAARGVLDDLVGQVMHIDHGLADAGTGELVQHVIEQWLAGHAHQRLRHMVGQRAHAQTETGGKDHGFGGRNGHSWNCSWDFSNHQIAPRIIPRRVA